MQDQIWGDYKKFLETKSKDNLFSIAQINNCSECNSNKCKHIVKLHLDELKKLIGTIRDEFSKWLSQNKKIVTGDPLKLDFKVIAEIPLAQRAGKSRSMLGSSDMVLPGVMACVMEHRCVPRAEIRSIMDLRVSHCCMAFELEFPVSREIAAKQGYLAEILRMRDQDGLRMRDAVRLRQMQIVEREIEKAWGMKL